MSCYSPKSKHMAGKLELCHLLWKLHLGTPLECKRFGCRPAVCHWILLDLDPQPTSTAVSSSPLANLCSFFRVSGQQGTATISDSLRWWQPFNSTLTTLHSAGQLCQKNSKQLVTDRFLPLEVGRLCKVSRDQ